MRAMVDADLCTACGLCEETCPDVFKVNDDTAEVLANPIPEDYEDAAKEAAANCPVEAIIIEK